jgi:hypothetical protein
MAETNLIEKLVGPSAPEKSVMERIRRSRKQAEDLTPEWKECLEFARGNHYAFVSSRNKLTNQATKESYDGRGKPKWRVRQSRNLIFAILDSKISAATQRVPGYEVIPSTTDSEDVSGAKLAEKIALSGYESWSLRRATEAATYYALTTGEAFAFPYWDSGVGPFVETEQGVVGIGDVRVKVYGAPEVSWEPGCQFDDSPFYVIEHARPIDSVKNEEGFLGTKLTPDAELDWRGEKTEPSQMVLVTEYLERPTAEYPNGRRMTIANGKLIFPADDYPLKGTDGRALDAPCLHRLSYMIDPSNDRDQGLVKQLIEPMRTFNDALNKVSEWKNVALSPQILAPVGSLDARTRPSDEPGSVVYYNPIVGHEPKWRPVPPIPSELFALADRMERLMGFISSDNQVPSQVESGKGIQSLLERDRLAWQNFIVKLADWHSAVMRDCLTLVQRYYTEPRVIQFRGRTGWESIRDFMGINLRNQTDVRVAPGSLEPRTRQAIEQRVMNYAQLGWVSPEAAMAAIDGGTAEKLIESYELDIARANLIISKLRSGEFLNEPPRPIFPGEEAMDPQTGEMLMEVPGWMPREGVDNVAVHKAVFSDWFKTDDWDTLAPEYKEASLLYFSALIEIETRQAERAKQLQAEEAMSQGMMNAAKPDMGTPQSSLPAIPS